MFVDELIDSGMDSQGVESALEVLKKSSRERNRNVFLISHREELMSRVSQVLVVQKENGFTTFSNDFESVEGA
jgi:DNA repair exonuclease SbcCD ATPase subunit